MSVPSDSQEYWKITNWKQKDEKKNLYIKSANLKAFLNTNLIWQIIQYMHFISYILLDILYYIIIVSYLWLSLLAPKNQDVDSYIVKLKALWQLALSPYFI